MTIDRTTEYLLSLLNELCMCKLPQETEWVEFKHSNDDPEQIGITSPRLDSRPCR